MKGMLVGGVNSNLEDSAAKAYCSNVAPAKRYVDHSESYSTNEICIYWNSPLVYLLAIGSSAEQTTENGLLGDVNQDQQVTIADLVLLKKYVLGDTKLTASQGKLADVTVDQLVNGMDISKLRQMLLAQTPTPRP